MARKATELLNKEADLPGNRVACPKCGMKMIVAKTKGDADARRLSLPAQRGPLSEVRSPQCMKQAISIRIAPEVLERARKAAKLENRTLTNFIETALKERLKTSPKHPK